MKFLKKLVPNKVKDRILYLLKNKILVSNRLKASELNSPFFVIASPGNLHIIKLCLDFIPADQEIVVILDGLEPWEKEWAQCHLNAKGSIIFQNRLTHGQVVEYLLNWMEQPFGLLDDDCFVFCQDCFHKIKQISSNTSISAYYGFTNEKLGLHFPETFFMFLNTPVLKRLKNQYKVTAFEMKWDRLPEVAKRKMKTAGISNENLPEPYKKVFDTLRVLMTLCVAENYQFYFPEGNPINYLKEQPKSLFHVGAVSCVPVDGVQLGNKSRARGSYFWYRTLEKSNYQELKDEYYKKYGYYTAEELLHKAKERIEDEFLGSVERVIARNQ